ncbi:hypothetical protein KPATCC21470_5299 [Kitasatospora purpeofusca]
MQYRQLYPARTPSPYPSPRGLKQRALGASATADRLPHRHPGSVPPCGRHDGPPVRPGEHPTDVRSFRSVCP